MESQTQYTVGATLVVAQNDMIDATEKGATTRDYPYAKPSMIWLGRSNQFPL